MQKFEFIVKDEEGIHARTSCLLVAVASEYISKVTIEKCGKTANGKSLLGVMALEAKCGDKVIFMVEGEDEDSAAKGMEEFCLINL